MTESVRETPVHPLPKEKFLLRHTEQRLGQRGHSSELLDSHTDSQQKLLPYLLFYFSISIFALKQNTQDNCKNADAVELT